MSAELQKKMDEIEKKLNVKFAEIRDLKALKKSYLLTLKLEQKIYTKTGGSKECSDQSGEAK